LQEVLISPSSSKEPGGCENVGYVTVASNTSTSAYASIDFTNPRFMFINVRSCRLSSWIVVGLLVDPARAGPSEGATDEDPGIALYKFSTNPFLIPFNILRFLHIIKCPSWATDLAQFSFQKLFAAQLELLTKFLRFTRPDLQHQDIPIA